MSLPRRCLLLAPAVLAGPARAHALVIGSEPAAGATLAQAPARAVLRFNSRIDAARSRLDLHGPEGAVRPLAVDRDTSPVTLEAPLPPLAPGAWRLRWQVLAADGHITRGDIAFRIAG